MKVTIQDNNLVTIIEGGETTEDLPNKFLYFDGKLSHHIFDWILTYCNFDSEKCPQLMKLGEKTIARAENGDEILIECKRYQEEV